jgi:rod shape-determining protein MreD
VSLFGFSPDLVLLSVVAVGIRSGQVEATSLGFLAGFLVDLQNPDMMGVNALADSIIGFAVGYGRIGIVAEDRLVQGLIVLVAGLLHDLLFFGFTSISRPADIFPQVIRYGIGTAIYSAVLAVVISLALSVRVRGGIHLDVRRFHG